MAPDYEAIVVTGAGTYRASRLTNSELAIEEDGVEGIVDVITLDENEVALWAPESLIPALISWVYEMRRGVGILSARLSMTDRWSAYKYGDVESENPESLDNMSGDQ